MTLHVQILEMPDEESRDEHSDETNISTAAEVLHGIDDDPEEFMVSHVSAQDQEYIKRDSHTSAPCSSLRN